MTNNRTLHPASAPGTHPSYSSPGLHAFDCDECGDTVQYTGRLDSKYQFHNETVGVKDLGTGKDWCADCAADIYGESDDED